MPSDKAEAARQRSKEIMMALQDGKPGDADKMMGDRNHQSQSGLVGLGWLKDKFGGKKKQKEEKEEKSDGVIR